jgi:hypothetical protein
MNGRPASPSIKIETAANNQSKYLISNLNTAVELLRQAFAPAKPVYITSMYNSACIHLDFGLVFRCNYAFQKIRIIVNG